MCKPCRPGEFNPNSGLNERCEQCSRGSHTPTESQISCVECVAGKFARLAGSSKCLECPFGWTNTWNAAWNCSVAQGTTFCTVQLHHRGCFICCFQGGSRANHTPMIVVSDLFSSTTIPNKYGKVQFCIVWVLDFVMIMQFVLEWPLL